MNRIISRLKGFTLLEIMLVSAVMASILILLVNYSSLRVDQSRRDKAVLQMQQILNAGLAYYTQYGKWPVDTCNSSAGYSTMNGYTLLQTNGFLPQQPMPSPYEFLGPSHAYSINCDGGSAVLNNTQNSVGNFKVNLETNSANDAQIIAGQLPMAVVSGATVTAQVPVPGQNLNNARSLNYTGVYFSGACVPAPTCPSNMTPEIVVVPEAVAGTYDAPTDSNGVACSTSTLYNASGSATTTGDCTSIASYPVTSYEAFAVGPVSISGGVGPASCSTPQGAGAACYSDANYSIAANQISTGSYWRVCLAVGSEKGPVNTQITSGSTFPGTGAPDKGLFWTQSMGKIVVFTRCIPATEPTGSGINVWSP